MKADMRNCIFAQAVAVIINFGSDTTPDQEQHAHTGHPPDKPDFIYAGKRDISGNMFSYACRHCVQGLPEQIAQADQSGIAYRKLNEIQLSIDLSKTKVNMFFYGECERGNNNPFGSLAVDFFKLIIFAIPETKPAC